MFIYVPRSYYSDEKKYKQIKMLKPQLRETLGVDKVNYKFQTDGDVYCSDESKNEIVQKIILG